MPVLDKQVLRFEQFELDPRCGELRKSGVKIKLQGQPILVLAILLEKPGELVTREEIRQRLWTSDTFVDFDHNLNTAVKKLRQAIGDEAETPRYIETVPKYGYRFIGEVANDEVKATAMALPAEAVTLAAADVSNQPEANPQRRRLRHISYYFIAITAGIVCLGLLAAWYSRPVEVAPRVLVRSQLSLFQPSLQSDGERWALSPLSANARYFVYVGGSQTLQLWLKDLQQDTDEPLPGTESGHYPFWSADGRHIGFFAGNYLKKIALDSRIVTTICEQDVTFSSWGNSGSIVMSTPRGIQVVSAESGAKRNVYGQRAESIDTRPSFLPDGQHFLFMRVPANRYFSRGESGTLFVGALDGSPPRSLGLRVTGQAAYAAGYLLFPTQHGLFAQAFDPSTSRLRGEPSLLVKSHGLDVVFAASENGVLVSRLVVSYQAGESQIKLYSRDGKPEKMPVAQGFVDEARFSPDGTRIAFAQTSGDNRDIWIHDLRRHVDTRLTPGDSSYFDPVWSPDGKRVAYTYFGARTRGTAVRNSDGTGNPEVLFETSNENPLHYWVRSWGPDDCLFITVTEITGPRSIQVLCLQDDRHLRPLPHPKSTSRNAQVISPDGKLLAYMSFETGRAEILVEPYPGPGKSVRISTEGGHFPSWRRDGRELFFLSKNSVVAVSVSYSGGEIKLGSPTQLFSLTEPMIHTGLPFDASPDGKYFAINTSLVKPSGEVNVISNWDTALKKHAP